MATVFDQGHMRRAIALAHARLGSTWPNPTVGCVIAHGETVIAEAVTGPGGPGSAAQRRHAEEQALIAAGEAARGGVAYVTLEPCGRRSSGRPSCADRLVAAGVARVAVACADPSPLASGLGLERLRAAGIPVESDLLAGEAAGLYAGYRRRLDTGRPLILAADNALGFDAEFTADSGEDLARAVSRLGEAGYTRVWVKRGEPLENRLRQAGLLD
ncbi:MAG TPA: bifunctional diaminohydroxyphosphoribosylaminopyrimidine deaminase/5-amino-6-(5-phosphoribosylamino)uracil reductase RibD [Caulobacteraceae bacterium]|jgi:diaminohydroxyphosphoribosylaminopyrimidine deaminase/5-amino-6-(5-phosphoribosylamino)uracil reductase|nr:bifunctional diaminohydroxyphosphoribosylaminopyrimidine deaminase/5-amino-6-(5-phosphoribosylamino)uracil reductase RibD [Caulobacteraceae bacterium]